MTIKFYEGTPAENWREWGSAEKVKKLFSADVIPAIIHDWLDEHAGATVEEAASKIDFAAALEEICDLYGWNPDDDELREIWSAVVAERAEKEIKIICGGK